MIEKPKRPKKIPNQDNKQPQTIQELIRRYDLDNVKIYDFLDELVDSLRETQIVVSATEPTGDNREKVWIKPDTTNGNKIYVKNYNDIYEQFIKNQNYNIQFNSEVISNGIANAVVMNGWAFINLRDIQVKVNTSTHDVDIAYGLPPVPDTIVLLNCADGSNAMCRITTDGKLKLFWSTLKQYNGATAYFGSLMYKV